MSLLEQLQVDMDLGLPIADMTGDPIEDMTADPISDMEGWQEVTDVLDDPITIRRGNFDGLPFARVAETGTATLMLDNSANNSAGREGYYSPDHANCRGGFELGKRLRIGLKIGIMSNLYYKFQGKIVDIDPEPGLLSRKVTRVSVVDWMDIAARTPMPQVGIQTNKTDDQVMQAILDALDTPPDATNLPAGPYPYKYSLTDLQDENDKIVAAMQALAQSGLGRFTIKGGTASGEQLAYEDIYALTDPDKPILITLDSAFLDLPGLGRKAYKRIKRVLGTVYPLSHDETPVVLYEMPQSIRIGPGQSVQFTIHYRETDSSKKRVAVTSTVDLVPDTDYKFSSTDGSSNDMNGDLAIMQFAGGNSQQLYFANTSSTQTGYLWLLKLRGYGVYRTNSITYTAVDDEVKESEGVTLDLKLPYQDDYNVAADISTMLLEWLDVIQTDVPTAEIPASLSDELLSAAITGEPGAKIRVIDPVSGISAYFFMLGYELTLNFVGDIRCRWALTRAIEAPPILALDVDGKDALDTDEARLGF